eukprot:CAMPEP_0197862766 /NCGR_PEP_ID=MMETSP1438-20131217/39759_1 /TAXON_ID=1461541 /ORGANISM="Pterosperma sp., Strain CCMP1384" /LENGTH=135 /DNA_ID=CAMNT_0043480429 /DNA_START=761 /DNA_END=1169 /DNA_ORIENTATION=+
MKLEVCHGTLDLTPATRVDVGVGPESTCFAPSGSRSTPETSELWGEPDKSTLSDPGASGGSGAHRCGAGADPPNHRMRAGLHEGDLLLYMTGGGGGGVIVTDISVILIDRECVPMITGCFVQVSHTKLLLCDELR